LDGVGFYWGWESAIDKAIARLENNKNKKRKVS
jgi:hypothetical protein